MQTLRWHARTTALVAGLLLADPAVAGAVAGSVPAHQAAHIAGPRPDRLARSGHPLPAGGQWAQRRPATVAAFRLSYPNADNALRAWPVAVSAARARQQRQLPDTGFDGMAVAAAGTALAGAGWLLMLAASLRLRRRGR